MDGVSNQVNYLEFKLLDTFFSSSLCSGVLFKKSKIKLEPFLSPMLSRIQNIDANMKRCLLSYPLLSSRQFHMLPKAKRQVSLKCNADKLPTAI